MEVDLVVVLKASLCTYALSDHRSKKPACA